MKSASGVNDDPQIVPCAECDAIEEIPFKVYTFRGNGM